MKHPASQLSRGLCRVKKKGRRIPLLSLSRWPTPLLHRRRRPSPGGFPPPSGGPALLHQRPRVRWREPASPSTSEDGCDDGGGLGPSRAAPALPCPPPPVARPPQASSSANPSGGSGWMLPPPTALLPRRSVAPLPRRPGAQRPPSSSSTPRRWPRACREAAAGAVLPPTTHPPFPGDDDGDGADPPSPVDGEGADPPSCSPAKGVPGPSYPARTVPRASPTNGVAAPRSSRSTAPRPCALPSRRLRCPPLPEQRRLEDLRLRRATSVAAASHPNPTMMARHIHRQHGVPTGSCSPGSGPPRIERRGRLPVSRGLPPLAAPWLVDPADSADGSDPGGARHRIRLPDGGHAALPIGGAPQDGAPPLNLAAVVAASRAPWQAFFSDW